MKNSLIEKNPITIKDFQNLTKLLNEKNQSSEQIIDGYTEDDIKHIENNFKDLFPNGSVTYKTFPHYAQETWEAIGGNPKDYLRKNNPLKNCTSFNFCGFTFHLVPNKNG